MRKIFILVILMSLVFTYGVASAASKCWRLDPYTDTIKVTSVSFSSSYIQTVAIVGSWVITAENHQDLIPMVGTIQRDLNGKLRLMLHGTVKDLSLKNPFIYQCNIDATLCPSTWTSVEIPVPEDGPTTHSSVLAYCENYFSPDNPFTSDVKLIPVPCSTVPNP